MQTHSVKVDKEHALASAREAVALARAKHGDAPDFSRDFLIVDEAGFLTGQRIAERLIPALGVEAHIAPASYWERIAAPFVAEVLAEDAPPSPCCAQDNEAPEFAVDDLKAALAANGGRIEGSFEDVIRALRRAQRANLARGA